MASKRVLMIGLDPDVVDYGRWPGLTPEKLRAGLERDAKALSAEGFEPEICFVDHGETAEATVGEALSRTPFDCIMIGAGVRKDEQEFELFEKLVNTVHRGAPDARLCFNTGPTDSVDAVKRWL